MLQWWQLTQAPLSFRILFWWSLFLHSLQTASYFTDGIIWKPSATCKAWASLKRISGVKTAQ